MKRTSYQFVKYGARLVCYLMMVVLSSVLLALAPHPNTPQIADYGFNGHRNWSHILYFVSIPISLVIAGVFVWHSKSPRWQKALLAVSIVSGGPFISLIAYCVFCCLVGARDGFL